MPRYAVISPHFDDGVLSLGGLLSSVGRQACLVTVCGGIPQSGKASNWDAVTGFGDGAEAAASRQKEDIAACGILDVDHVHLPYLDGPYRASASDLDTLFTTLSSVLKDATHVLAPLGIGEHEDHVAVRDQVLRAALAVPGAEVRLYADLPYAARFPRPRLAAWHLVDPRDDRVTDEHWRRKRDALFAYGSQLAPLGAIYGNVVASEGPLRRELTWRIQPEASASRAS